MKTSTRISFGLAVLATVVMGMMGARAARAVIVPATFPAQSNVFLNNFSTGGNGEWNGHDPSPSTLTDNDLDTIANSTAFSPGLDVDAAIFATPAASPASNVSDLGTFGPIDTIRIWGQPAFSGDFLNSYVIPPTQVSILYGFRGSNPQDVVNGIKAINFANQATILAVNGAAPTFLSPGVVDLTGDWQGPAPDNFSAANPDNSLGAYYVDLTVSVFSTNGLFFDLGESPNRSNGNGGLFVNEIQAGLSPEPASCAMLAIGATLMFKRRRRV